MIPALAFALLIAGGFVAALIGSALDAGKAMGSPQAWAGALVVGGLLACVGGAVGIVVYLAKSQ